MNLKTTSSDGTNDAVHLHFNEDENKISGADQTIELFNHLTPPELPETTRNIYINGKKFIVKANEFDDMVDQVVKNVLDQLTDPTVKQIAEGEMAKLGTYGDLRPEKFNTFVDLRLDEQKRIQEEKDRSPSTDWNSEWEAEKDSTEVGDTFLKVRTEEDGSMELVITKRVTPFTEKRWIQQEYDYREVPIRMRHRKLMDKFGIFRDDRGRPKLDKEGNPVSFKKIAWSMRKNLQNHENTEDALKDEVVRQRIVDQKQDLISNDPTARDLASQITAARAASPPTHSLKEIKGLEKAQASRIKEIIQAQVNDEWNDDLAAQTWDTIRTEADYTPPFDVEKEIELDFKQVVLDRTSYGIISRQYISGNPKATAPEIMSMIVDEFY